MSSSSDLAKAMKSALDGNGDLLGIRAQLEEDILQSSTDVSLERSITRMHKPAMPTEIILANNLVRQYLEYVGLHKTSSVLCTESGLPNKTVPENVMKAALPSVDISSGKPLLWSMVSTILRSDC